MIDLDQARAMVPMLREKLPQLGLIVDLLIASVEEQKARADNWEREARCLRAKLEEAMRPPTAADWARVGEELSARLRADPTLRDEFIGLVMGAVTARPGVKG